MGNLQTYVNKNLGEICANQSKTYFLICVISGNFDYVGGAQNMHHFQFESRLLFFFFGPVCHWCSLGTVLLRTSFNLFFITLASSKTYGNSLATLLELLFCINVIHSN